MKRPFLSLITIFLVSCSASQLKPSLVGSWSCNYAMNDGRGVEITNNFDINLMKDHTYSSVSLLTMKAAAISSTLKGYASGTWQDNDGILIVSGRLDKVEHIDGMNVAGFMKEGQHDGFKGQYELSNKFMNVMLSKKETIACNR